MCKEYEHCNIVGEWRKAEQTHFSKLKAIYQPVQLLSVTSVCRNSSATIIHSQNDKNDVI